MGWERRRIGLVAIACLLLAMSVGCNLCARPRHGLIVRGDWSFELNRVPWLARRAAEDSPGQHQPR